MVLIVPLNIMARESAISQLVARVNNAPLFTLSSSHFQNIFIIATICLNYHNWCGNQNTMFAHVTKTAENNCMFSMQTEPFSVAYIGK